MIELEYPNFEGKIDEQSVYILYMSIRNHFTDQKFDAIKYNFNIRVSKESYEKRGDRRLFESLSGKYDIKELTEIFLSNFVYSKNNWVNHMLSNEAETNRHKYINMIRSFSTIFKSDIEKIMYVIRKKNRSSGNEDMTLKGILGYDSKIGSSPLLNLLYSDNISSETFIIIDRLFNLTEKEYIKIPKFNLQWTQNKDFLKKYGLFLKTDLKLAKSIIIESAKRNEIKLK